MRRGSHIVRLFAVLSLALWFAGAATISTAGIARAQDVTPEPGSADVTPEATEPPAEGAQGTVTILVYTCANGPEGVTAALFLEGEFAPDASCAEEGVASLAVDGGAFEDVTSGAQLTLDEGEHTVTEATSGASLSVTIAADVPATLTAVLYTQAVDEGGAPVPAGSVLIMKHLCPDTIKTQADFDALGDFAAKLAACPVITLPGDAGPDGAITGNDPDAPLSFDFSVAYDDNGTPATKTISGGDATFTPGQTCESELGVDLNGDPNDDACFDTSHYAFAGVTQGPVTVTETTPPDGYAFGALETTPDSGDEAAVTNVDAQTGVVTLDTSNDDQVMLHVYNFVKPAENRVTIVKHLCPADITSRDALEQVGDFYDRLNACPVVTRGGDEPPAGAVAGGKRSFGFDVEGSDGAAQNLEDNAVFHPNQLCEADLKQDVDGDGQQTTCFSTSGYRFDNVLQGTGVLVTETKAPNGYGFGMVDTDPTTDDAAALVNESTDGVIELDTTSDGDVTLHVFNIVQTDEPTPTPTATATPETGDTGSVQVIKLYCLSDFEGAEITVLDPGQEATTADLGDNTCIAGDTDFQITAFGTDPLEPFSVGDDGVIVLDNIPVTTAETGPHTITELFYDVSADFDVEPNTTTRIIVLNYEIEEVDDGGDSSTDGEDDNYDTENDVTSGEDLAETGVGPAAGQGGGAMFLFGGMSLLALVGLAGLRRRAA